MCVYITLLILKEMEMHFYRALNMSWVQGMCLLCLNNKSSKYILTYFCTVKEYFPSYTFINYIISAYLKTIPLLLILGSNSVLMKPKLLKQIGLELFSKFKLKTVVKEFENFKVYSSKLSQAQTPIFHIVFS